MRYAILVLLVGCIGNGAIDEPQEGGGDVDSMELEGGDVPTIEPPGVWVGMAGMEADGTGGAGDATAGLGSDGSGGGGGNVEGSDSGAGGAGGSEESGSPVDAPACTPSFGAGCVSDGDCSCGLECIPTLNICSAYQCQGGGVCPDDPAWSCIDVSAMSGDPAITHVCLGG